MAKVNISSYSGSVVAGDWSPAFLAAWNAIKATGGTIYLDTQTMTMKTSVSFTPTSPNQVPLIIQGDGSNIITIDGAGSPIVPFGTGNLTGASFRDFIIQGPPAATTQNDCAAAFSFGYSYEVLLNNVYIAGLKTSIAAVSCGTATSLKVKDCQMSGNAGGPVILMDGGNGLVVDNLTCLDYETIIGNYLSRTAYADPQAWIQCINPIAANGQSNTSVTIRKSKFDEAAVYAVYAKDIPQITLDQLDVNVHFANPAAGVYLENVKKGTLRQCNLGYCFTADVAGARFINSPEVAMVDCTRDHLVTRVEADATSRAGLKMIRSGTFTIDAI